MTNTEQKTKTKAELALEAAIEAESKFPVFVSPGDSACLVALTAGGYAASVLPMSEGGTRLHPRFHRAAAMLGCMPIGVAQASVIPQSDLEGAQKDRKGMIFDEMARMSAEAVDSEQKRRELFTAAGVPDANALGRRLGFPITAAERDAVWAEYAKDDDDGSAADGDDD